MRRLPLLVLLGSLSILLVVGLARHRGPGDGPSPPGETASKAMTRTPGDARDPTANDPGSPGVLADQPRVPAPPTNIPPVPRLLPGAKEHAALALAGFPGATVERSIQVDDPVRPRSLVFLRQPGLPRPVRVVVDLGPDGPRVVEEAVADRLLLRVDPARSPDASAFASAQGLRVERVLFGGRAIVVAFDPADPLAADRLREAAGQVPGLSAEADVIVRAAATPDDPRYLDGSLWGLHNTGQDAGTPDADIDAPEAWDLRRSAPGVIVAVIDSGARLDHEDLAPNLWENPGEIAGDGIDNDGNGWVDDVHGIDAVNDDGDPTDDHGHGTHVSGTVAARGNNGVGIAGVAWEARLLPLKFLSSRGNGALADALTCIDYALEHGAEVLNNSWGSTTRSATLHDAIVAAREAGALFVAAAGNSTSNVDVSRYYPASHEVENVIAVASTNRNDRLSSFSSLGQGFVQLAAPGERILSARHSDPSGYVSFNGTSMATPAVSGALALLRAQYPSDPWWALRNRLLRGVDRIDALAGRVATGGRLNLRGALASPLATPPNDRAEDAWPVVGSTLALRCDNLGATRDPGEAAHAGIATADTSVWYRWRAPESGPVFLDTAASTFDTVLAVYRMDAGGTFAPVAANDDDATVAGVTTSRLSFVATGGDEFLFAVSGKAGATGLVGLGLASPPPGDPLARAVVVTEFPALGTGSNRYASKEPGEPDHAANAGGASIWAKWTPTAPARVVATTAGSAIDTLLAVYAGPAEHPTFGRLAPVAANDDHEESGSATSLLRFDAVPGTTYYLATDGFDGAEGALQLRLYPELANDAFERRSLLVGVPAIAELAVGDATREPGEPDHGGRGGTRSVWYRWVAPEAGDYQVDTHGSLAPTVLALYAGDTLGSLVPLAADADSGQGGRSRVILRLAAGAEIAIAVDNPGIVTGQVRLSIDRVQLPPNDAFAAAAALEGFPEPGRPLVVEGNSTGATTEPGEPGTADGGMPTGIWWRWTAPSSGRVVLKTEGSAFDTILDVFAGTTLGALVPVASDDDGGPRRSSRVVVDAVAGTSYAIRVHGYLQATGHVRLTLESWQAVANDAFASAIPVAADTLRLEVFTTEATAEPGEPAHADAADPAARSVWFEHVARSDGRLTVATDGSGYPTRVAVYVGDRLDALVPIASNDDYFLGTAVGQVSFQAVAGTRYRIAVDGDGGTSGRLLFTLAEGPSNDAFAHRRDLASASSVIDRVLNHGATRESGEPQHAGARGAKTAWWSWTAPATAQFEITTEGSTAVTALNGTITLDTGLAVYTGTALGSLTSVVANDDVYVGRVQTSRVILNAVAGTTYAIAVATVDTTLGATPEASQQGEVVLTLRRFGKAANDAFAAAAVVGSIPAVFAANNVGCGIEAAEPGTSNNPTPNTNSTRSRGTLWWRWTADRTGPVTAATSGLYLRTPSERTIVSVYSGPPSATFADLVLVGFDAEGNGGTYSALTFDAVAGTTYFFQVGAPDRGDLEFMISPRPANDAFSRAELRTGSSWNASGHNLGATIEAGEPRIDSPTTGRYLGSPTLARSVWWRWTAPATGTTTIDTLGGNVFTVLAVHVGDQLDQLRLVAKQDEVARDPYNGTQPRLGCARVVFTATAGTTYAIQVEGGFFGAGSVGRLQLALTQSVQPQGEPFVTVHATNPEAREGGAYGAVAVARSHALELPLAVSLAVGGTAEDGVDMEPLPRRVVLPAGVARVDVPVVALEDGLLESRSPETVRVDVAPGLGYRAGAASAASVGIVDALAFTETSPTSLGVEAGATAALLRWAFPPSDHVAWRLQRAAPTNGLLAESSFDDLAEGPLVGNGGWQEHAPGTAEPRVVPGGLVVSEIDEPGGKRVFTAAKGLASTRDVRLPFPNPSGSPGVVASFRLRLDDVSSLGSGWQVIAQLVAGSTNGPALFVRRSGTGAYDLGIHKRSNGTLLETSTALQGLSAGGVLHLVLRYRAVGAVGTDDAVDLWLNPSPASLGDDATIPSPTFSSFGGNDASGAWTSFVFLPPAQVDSALDALRVATTWAAATAPPWAGDQAIPGNAPAGVLAGLEPGSTTRVRIRAEGPTGIASRWSEPLLVATTPSPTLVDWSATAFEGAVPASARAPEADPDGDGLPNLLEAALGADPSRASTGPVAAPDSSGEGLVLRFPRARGDLRYVVETSLDLRTWTPLATDPGAPGEVVDVPLPQEGTLGAARLRVTRPD